MDLGWDCGRQRLDNCTTAPGGLKTQAHVMMYSIVLTRITNATDARLGVAAGDGMDGGGFSHSSSNARWSAGIMSVDNESVAMCFSICS